MRKMKKINGYLVVRFNDREKREYEGTGLGNFGVIDAELYTGILDVDRSVMEYDDIETLEIALEQARGLESELDVVEPEVKITVIIEGETEVSEEDVEPESLFKGHRATLEAQLRHGPHLDLDPLTAAHELHGYARALEDLGMIDGHDERFLVERDTFGATAPPPDQQEEALAYICDEVCKYREGRTQEELDGICAKCKVDRWAGAPPTLTPQEVRELRHLRRLLKEVSDYVNDGGPATPGSSARRLEVKLPERITPETLQKIMNAAQSGESPRETFENAPSGIRNDYNTKKVYALGLALVEECPENDCKVYLNIFNMARELDAALGMMEGNMAQYLGLVKLGGFYNNGTILKRPTKPWRPDTEPYSGCGVGDIPQMSGSMANYTLGSTPAADANKLQWHKIRDGSKTLLICDRNILVSVSWNDLNEQGYITGKTVTIDGATYKCRVLTGGTGPRSSDWYAGGTPTNNEWDRFITREEVITGLPAPTSSDLDTSLAAADKTSAHNQFWNWMGCYSWCQEVYSGNSSYRAVRGYFSARLWNYNYATFRNVYVGFRPVLEILNTDPLISDSDRNLGDKNTNFTIQYSVDDPDSGDVLTATESIDGRTTKSFGPTRNFVYTISVPVDELSLGTHTVKVVVTDGKGGAATRTWTFTRTNSTPTISGVDGNLGDKNLGFTYDYTVNDADGDTLTVTEQLNDETIRTINNAPKGEPLGVAITSEKLYTLDLNSVNTITIMVTDGKGGTSYRGA